MIRRNITGTNAYLGNVIGSCYRPRRFAEARKTRVDPEATRFDKFWLEASRMVKV